MSRPCCGHLPVHLRCAEHQARAQLVTEELLLHLSHLHFIVLLQLLDSCLVSTGYVQTALNSAQDGLQCFLLPGGSLLGFGDILDFMILCVEVKNLLDNLNLNK